jgi:inner membrane protein
MEPVTHILTGACLSRTGLNRYAAYATLAMAVAAELPDIDTLWSLHGPVAGFEHHRGITHTFIGIPFEAAVVVAAIYGLHHWRTTRASKLSAKTAAPVRWGLLYCFTLLALLSHLFLDFTNNYGIRPFFPFNPRWYAASIVFIFDPLIFVLLLAALVLPSIFRLVSSEVGARRQPFAARGWAIAALFAIVALWTFRETQHNRAVQLAMAQSIAAPQVSSPITQPASPAPPDQLPVYLQPQRALASPDPLSLFRWYTVTDFGPLYQLAEANTSTSTIIPNQITQPKLNPSPALLAAEASPLGRAYLDWSSLPFITITQASSTTGLDDLGDTLAPGHTIVQFADPRFMGDALLLHTSRHTPLTGTVELNAANRVVKQSMDGRVQRP